MRELIYLSDRKLQQFVAGKPRRWWSRTGAEAELDVPFVGKAKVSKPEGDHSRSPSLDRVIRSLEESERAARWFEDEDLSAGQWIHFESRMNFTFMKGLEAVVFFVDYKPDEQPNQWHDERLLLHGSAAHLLEGEPVTKSFDRYGYGSQWSAVIDFAQAMAASAKESLNTDTFLSNGQLASGLFDPGSPWDEAFQATFDEIGSSSSTEGLVWRAFYDIARDLVRQPPFGL